jgi:Inner membrane protein YgaP-like, transmembrane domain
VYPDGQDYDAHNGFQGGKMKKNIHPVERAIRIIVGALIASLAFWGPANYWFLLGLIPLITGLLGWCPPYQLLGISTCPKPKQVASSGP